VLAARAGDDAWNEAIEAAAKVVDENVEVVSSGENKRYMQQRRDGDLVSVAYATAIRLLKRDPNKQDRWEYLMDSQYKAGMKAGWNEAIEACVKELHAMDFSYTSKQRIKALTRPTPTAGEKP